MTHKDGARLRAEDVRRLLARDAALATYGPSPALRDRALFHARCTLFEDLAYGGLHTEKSLAGLAWLFPHERHRTARHARP